MEELIEAIVAIKMATLKIQKLVEEANKVINYGRKTEKGNGAPNQFIPE